MNNLLNHKGYFGTVEYSATDGILFGKVLGIRGLISYEGDSIQILKEDFESAIDTYLESCAEDGVEPQNPNMGTFDVRVSPELHTALEIYSQSRGQTLNSTVEDAIRRLVSA